MQQRFVGDCGRFIALLWMSILGSCASQQETSTHPIYTDSFERLRPETCPQGTDEVQRHFGVDDNYLVVACQDERGTLHGQYRTYYPDGAISSEGTYEGGQRTGIWLTWFDTGERWTHEFFQAGVQHGAYLEWYRSGQLHIAGDVYEGESDGEWSLWHENGQRAYEAYYDHGLAVGTWREWDEAGQLKCSLEFVDGEPTLLTVWSSPEHTITREVGPQENGVLCSYH